MKTNEVLDGRTFDNSIRGYITVNGVKLNNSQMLKKEEKVRKTPVRKVKKDDERKNSLKTTPPVNKISNYFSRSEDDTKVKMTLAETGVVNSETRTSLQAGVVRVQGEGMVKDGQQRRVGDMNETKKTFSTVKPKKNDVKKKIEQFTRFPRMVITV